MIILDGKKCSEYYRSKVAQIIKKIIEKGEKPPRLTAFLIGDNSSSAMYVNMKEKACAEVGMEARAHVLTEETPEDSVIEMIKAENADPQTAGILVQLPLPKKYNEKRILSVISRQKDADCFLDENIGQMFLGNDITVLPCTPLGVMKLLKFYNIDVAGKEVCIIGRSNIVGKPLMLLMLSAHATITVCHSKTKNLKDITKRADILIAAIGRAKMIDASYVKPGAVVIDVGINKIPGPDGKLKTCGDCDFESISTVAGWATPVPGGIGPMTIAMVLYNTVYNYVLMKNLDIDMNLEPQTF